jgi:demethylmenaquinone methyltransferase/2-methoxy-6-polyprenyl-1,4-benzoquinol methylase
MTHLSGQERGAYVQKMFARIASRYDLMNRLMTGWFDLAWRREVIRRARLQSGQRLLDLGTGTGDLAMEAHRRHPQVDALAADFTIEMMRSGQRREGAQALRWFCADALNIPFTDNSFDALVSGFLVRNVGDLSQALSEQIRVLKPGGRLVIPPVRQITGWRPLFRFTIDMLSRCLEDG